MPVYNTRQRARTREDGWPTRSDIRYDTDAERLCRVLVGLVEEMGASLSLTRAVTLLAQAREAIADHVERVDAVPSLPVEPATEGQAMCWSPVGNSPKWWKSRTERIVAWVNANGGEARYEPEYVGTVGADDMGPQTPARIAVRTSAGTVYAKPGDTIDMGDEWFDEPHPFDTTLNRAVREFTVRTAGDAEPGR